MRPSRERAIVALRRNHKIRELQRDFPLPRSEIPLRKTSSYSEAQCSVCEVNLWYVPTVKACCARQAVQGTFPMRCHPPYPIDSVRTGGNSCENNDMPFRYPSIFPHMLSHAAPYRFSESVALTLNPLLRTFLQFPLFSVQALSSLNPRNKEAGYTLHDFVCTNETLIDCILPYICANKENLIFVQSDIGKMRYHTQ